MSTLDEARAAKGKVKKQLKDTFNGSSSPMVGISKDKEGYFVSVGLERQPTPAECTKLPQECDGVRVKYKVTGPIVAL